jgi:hypothetical protein
MSDAEDVLGDLLDGPTRPTTAISLQHTASLGDLMSSIIPERKRRVRVETLDPVVQAFHLQSRSNKAKKVKTEGGSRKSKVISVDLAPQPVVEEQAFELDADGNINMAGAMAELNEDVTNTGKAYDAGYSGRKPTKVKWSPIEVELLYEALSVYGTDFTLAQTMSKEGVSLAARGPIELKRKYQVCETIASQKTSVFLSLSSGSIRVGYTRHFTV